MLHGSSPDSAHLPLVHKSTLPIKRLRVVLTIVDIRIRVVLAIVEIRIRVVEAIVDVRIGVVLPIVTLVNIGRIGYGVLCGLE